MSHSSNTLGWALSVSLLITSPLSAAQCSDPPTPPDGFTIQQDIDVPFVWTDGYQVLMDVRYPVDAPGPCGWPLIVLVHGGGGEKSVVAGTAAALAGAGYITLAYDVRGQGPSMGNNPATLSHDYVGLRELVDLFEAMEAAEALYPALVDFDRIGVTGYSQGGRHSWWAAQHSGLLPPPNPWRVQAFPEVAAIVVRDNSAGRVAGNLTAFNPSIVDSVFGTSQIVHQPAFTATLAALILAEDFSGLHAALTVPGMDPSVLVPQTTVPVFAHASYDDKKVNPSGVLGSWNLLPRATAKRLQLGTGGHDSPSNERDRSLFSHTRRRWLDRFLKGELNGVDVEPPVFASVTPDDVGTYQDAASLWDFREYNGFPAAGAENRRLYLAAGSGLVASPAAAATSQALVHTVPGFFDIAAYTSLLPGAGQLEMIIPLSTFAYDSPPLSSDVHVEGTVSVELSVDTFDPDYQIHAVLYDVDPGGFARFVTSGSAKILGSAGPSTVVLRPYVQSYVFRAGHSMRLQLENLVTHRPPTGSAPYLKSVPYFSSSSVDVLAGGATPSFLDVPTRPFDAPTLSTFPFQQSVASLENQRMTIHSSSAGAGDLYLLLPSLSGTSPGTSLGSLHVPLNFDALTFMVLTDPAAPPFVNALGVLDGQGSGDVGILLQGYPLPPTFAGLELSMAAGIFASGILVTNPVTVPFLP